MRWYKTGLTVVLLATLIVSLTLLLNRESVPMWLKSRDCVTFEDRDESKLENAASDKTESCPQDKLREQLQELKRYIKRAKMPNAGDCVTFEDRDESKLEHAASDKTESCPQDKLREQLQELKRYIKRAKMHIGGTKTSNDLRKATKLLNEVVKLFPKRAVLSLRNTVEPSSVCPEEYLNANEICKHASFNIKKCTHGKSLRELVTVVIHKRYTELAGERLSILLNYIHKDYKDVKIIIASNSNIVIKDVEMANVQILTESDASDGETLNKLVKQVNTPYVLIARDIEILTHDARLDRLIREIETQQVSVAAGAVRDPNGHWEIGCYQTVRRNYSLTYFRGYDKSFRECVFCDFVSGPFLTSVRTTQKYHFADMHYNRGLFEDWFLRLAKDNIETIICPDSMFFTTYTQEDDEWTYFMTAWNLFEIHTSGGQSITSKCSDTLLNSTVETALSSCRMKANAENTRTLMELCEKHSLICELNGKTVLAAVQFGHVLPVEKNVDVLVLSNNFTAYRDVLSKLFNVTPFQKDCDSRLFKTFSEDWKVNVLERNSLESAKLIAVGLKPTRLLYDGHWLIAPRNPGLYLRDRYWRDLF